MMSPHRRFTCGSEMLASRHIRIAPEWCGIIERRKARSPIVVCVRISAKDPANAMIEKAMIAILAGLDGNMCRQARIMSTHIGATITSVMYTMLRFRAECHRGGNEWDHTCTTRGHPHHKKKKT